MPDTTTALLEARKTLDAFIRRRVTEPADADDLVQETLLRALKAAPSLRHEEKIEAWLYQIARNAVAEYRRQRARLSPLDDIPEHLPDTPSQEDAALLCTCLKALLPLLHPPYAELIEAVDLEGEPPSVAAGRLGLTPGNLKVRLHRARRQLRARLETTCRTCATHGCLDCSCSTSRLPSA
jgi:RNA polymerase sigma-70 factor, ECF subfamily